MNAPTTLTIIFFGLVAHVQLPHSTMSTAALPSEPSHRALMTIPDSAVDHADNWLKQFDEAKLHEYRIPLKGIHVMISGLSLSDTDSSAIKEVVPSLTEISACRKLKQSVLHRTPTDAVGAFVDYSGGRLEPLTYFGSMGYVENVPGWDVPHCMPCEMRLTTEMTGTLVTMTFLVKKQTYVAYLKPNSKIGVSNNVALDAKLKQPPKDASHFVNYYSIFSDKCEQRTVKKSNGCLMDPSVICVHESVPDPDCTNSHYP